VLVLALSTHALFEGISLGLTNELSASLCIMFGLAIRKWSTSMALGTALSNRFKHFDIRGAILFMALGLATPIGILIGLIVAPSNNYVEMTLNSIGGGTFIYIAVSEIVIEEFAIMGS
jgi:zinc transporter ZupT